jgi:hypothetical protein
MTTILKHLIECKWCDHIQFQHNDKEGFCMIGGCACIEFREKEKD